MNLELILGLIKVGLEVYKDETRDRYLKKYLRIKNDYQEELNKGIDSWSDLNLNKLLLESEDLARLIIAGQDGKNT